MSTSTAKYPNLTANQNATSGTHVISMPPGGICSNLGAVGDVTWTLPSGPVDGDVFTFFVALSVVMHVTYIQTDTAVLSPVYIVDQSGIVCDYLYSSKSGACVTLTFIGTAWFVTAHTASPLGGVRFDSHPKP